MRFALAALSASEILLAKKPEIGLESRVFVSVAPIQKLGRITVTAAGVPTWIPEPGVTWGSGLDLHIKVDSPVRATTAPTVTLDVTLDDDVVGTALATFATPSWVPDQSKSYQVGAGFDFIPQGGGNSAKLIKAIAGVDSVANITQYCEFVVYGSPAASNFVEMGWKKGATSQYATPASIALPDGYNPAGAIKLGRPELPELTINLSHVAASAGMVRYNGHNVAVLLKVIKDKSVHASNIVYCGYRPQASPDRGEGNDEVVESSAGPFEDCMQFDAL